jgi:hypothetical protein
MLRLNKYDNQAKNHVINNSAGQLRPDNIKHQRQVLND